MTEGWINGGITLIPSMGGLYLAMQNAKFRRYTNWQSRTALVIMPALFAFAFTAETKLVNRMEEVAEETEHSIRSVHWAESEFKNNPQDKQLHDLYRQAVLNSGVKLVEGDELQTHHKVANYVQTNPFKVIMGIGIPAVGLIFYGRTGKEHLSMQLKILHTRVFGQFAVICTLLGVMGVKGFMDAQGRFITDDEVETRVDEMYATRQKLLHRIEDQNASHMPYHKN
eukprot:Nitzschia sp. Nitz4//scaffold382_size14485//11838//12657//NITZ4_008940-RA/size14485-snap-gene-0.14-mRNA-1//-1//CDS//3329549929//8419//frame0